MLTLRLGNKRRTQLESVTYTTF
uniref:Uncharacterized protein n=1 Tax=Anguilla anguilla TaxID=7936 RepID=A0A0E9U9D9_ANGAN